MVASLPSPFHCSTEPAPPLPSPPRLTADSLLPNAKLCNQSEATAEPGDAQDSETPNGPAGFKMNQTVCWGRERSLCSETDPSGGRLVPRHLGPYQTPIWFFNFS